MVAAAAAAVGVGVVETKKAHEVVQVLGDHDGPLYSFFSICWFLCSSVAIV